MIQKPQRKYISQVSILPLLIKPTRLFSKAFDFSPIANLVIGAFLFSKHPNLLDRDMDIQLTSNTECFGQTITSQLLNKKVFVNSTKGLTAVFFLILDQLSMVFRFFFIILYLDNYLYLRDMDK